MTWKLENFVEKKSKNQGGSKDPPLPLRKVIAYFGLYEELECGHRIGPFNYKNMAKWPLKRKCKFCKEEGK